MAVNIDDLLKDPILRARIVELALSNPNFATTEAKPVNQPVELKPVVKKKTFISGSYLVFAVLVFVGVVCIGVIGWRKYATVQDTAITVQQPVKVEPTAVPVPTVAAPPVSLPAIDTSNVQPVEPTALSIAEQNPDASSCAVGGNDPCVPSDGVEGVKVNVKPAPPTSAPEVQPVIQQDVQAVVQPEVQPVEATPVPVTLNEGTHKAKKRP